MNYTLDIFSEMARFKELDEGATPNTHITHLHGLAVGLMIVFLLGISLNAISIVVILRSKNLQSINILILNLAIADIIYTLGLVYASLFIFDKQEERNS